MWNTVSLLFLLINFQLVVSYDHFKERKCPEGQYNYRGLGMCFNCTQCAEFLYEQEKCTKTSNTVCGWCGKEPDFDKISDTVLASYQTKCMMSRLEFVDMKKLKTELREDAAFFSEEDEAKELPSLTLRKSESVEDEKEVEKADSQKEHPFLRQLSLVWSDDEEDLEDLNHLAKVRGKFLQDIFNLPPSKNTDKEDLPDPSDRVTDDSAAQEENEDSFADESTEGKIEQTVSDSVNAYLIKKGKKINKNKLKGAGSVTILSRDEVEASLKQLVELSPAQRRVYSSDEDSDSSESSNERSIKWDKWLDDNIKPIKEKSEKREKSSVKYASVVDTIFAIVSLIFGIAIVLSLGIVAGVQMWAEKKKSFAGVPTDAPDYHMIVDASNYIDELAKKEKKAARHVHDNPVFDI